MDGLPRTAGTRLAVESKVIRRAEGTRARRSPTMATAAVPNQSTSRKTMPLKRQAPKVSQPWPPTSCGNSIGTAGWTLPATAATMATSPTCLSADLDMSVDIPTGAGCAGYGRQAFGRTASVGDERPLLCRPLAARRQRLLDPESGAAYGCRGCPPGSGTIKGAWPRLRSSMSDPAARLAMATSTAGTSTIQAPPPPARLRTPVEG